jgi:gliding motility-associated-like protein
MGCEETIDFTINQTEELNISASIIDAKCGLANGQVTVTADGGIEPYYYIWSNGQSGTVNTNYDYEASLNSFVYVSDVNDCSDTLFFDVDGSDDFDVTIESTDEHCNQSNATATIEFIGGLEPFDIEWSNGQTGIQTLNLSSVENYFVISTDANNCSDTTYFNVDMIGSPTASVETTPSYCYQNNGTATASAQGGASPYIFEWSTGEQGDFIDSLNEMMVNYLIVTDQNNCTDSISFSVGFEGGVEIIGVDVQSESCFNSNDGSIDVELNGEEPSEINWSNGVENTTILEDLSSGEYTITVIDSNNCVGQETYLVSPADSIMITSEVNFESCLDEDGSISVYIEGGIEPYMIYWDNGDVGDEIVISELGEYVVEVTDYNDCQNSLSIIVQASEGDDDCLTIPSGFSPNGDYINDTWFIEGLELYENSSVKLFNRWGQLVYENIDYQNDWNGKDNHGRELPFGTYYYVLELENESTYTGDVLIKR